MGVEAVQFGPNIQCAVVQWWQENTYVSLLCQQVAAENDLGPGLQGLVDDVPVWCSLCAFVGHPCGPWLWPLTKGELFEIGLIKARERQQETFFHWHL